MSVNTIEAVTPATDEPIPYTLTTAAEAAIEVAKRWTITTTNGITVSGYLPPWAKQNPSVAGIQPDHLVGTLDDIGHRAWYPGVKAEVTMGRDDATLPIMCPQIECDPFHEDPAKRVPTVSVELAEGCDDWIGGLDPDGVRRLADKLRAQAAVLDQVAADLADARADWAKNGGSGPQEAAA